MNDIIVSINEDTPEFMLWLFPDAASIHVWKTEHDAKLEVLPHFAAQGHAHGHKFLAGESFRLNWFGAELVCMDKKTSAGNRYDLVCLIQQQETAGEAITRAFKGWVSRDVIDMSPHVGSDITVITADASENMDELLPS